MITYPLTANCSLTMQKLTSQHLIHIAILHDIISYDPLTFTRKSTYMPFYASKFKKKQSVKSVCKEHAMHIKHLNDKDSVLRLAINHMKQKQFLVIFFSVLQLVGIEVTYEGIECKLGVKNRRNYAKIVGGKQVC